MSEEDRWMLITLVLCTILIVLFGVWVLFFAPCADIGWVPMREAPLRCLGGR